MNADSANNNKNKLIHDAFHHCRGGGFQTRKLTSAHMRIFSKRTSFMSIVLVVTLLLLGNAVVTEACDGNHCCYNSDCGGNFCEGGHGINCKCAEAWWSGRFNTGQCRSRRANGQWAYNWDYESCHHRNGICGVCGPKVSDGKSCSANSDCYSGWCEGQVTVGCRGTCRRRRANGELAYKGDYNSCTHGNGVCGVCGPKVPAGKKCSANSDCESGWCDGEFTVGCGGTCKDKIDDNKQCPQRSVTNEGFNEACKSGECMEMLKLYPWMTTAYCRPPGGFLAPAPCTQDADCSSAGRGHWCNGGAYNKLGKCEMCPAKCTNGCHACDNDISRMNCGRSSTFDKIGCAAEVAAGDILEFLECLTGIDMACIEAVAGEIGDCINGECVFKIGGDCLSFEQEFSWDKELFENKANFDVNLSGNMKLNVGMELTLDLKEWQFTLDTVSTVTKSLEIDAESQAEYTYSEEKDLAPKKTVFRKVFMVGKVPVLLEVDVQPMAWFDFETMASFNANMQLSGEMKYKQSFTVDIDDGEFSSSESPLNGKDAVPSIDNLSVSGDFSANADVRVGPRINFSVYKVPVSLDIAAKVGVSTELKGSVDHSGKACATGSAQLSAGLEARLGMTVPLLDPVAFAKEACEEAARTMIELANPANHMIDRAQCFTDILDIDTSAIDDAQEEMNEAMADLADEICNGAIDFLVPASLQELSAAGSSFGSGHWNNIISVEAGVEKGLCGNVELNEPGSSPGGLAPAQTPSTSSNIALGKPTTLTNTSHGAHGSRAVDGNTNGHWSQGSTTHTHLSTNPSWLVDLKSTFTISTVKVYNRQDCCANRLSGFKLIIWKGAQQAWTYTQSGGTPSHLTTISVPMIDGDTVEITLPGSNRILSLAEVEVFGKTAPAQVKSPHLVANVDFAYPSSAPSNTPYQLKNGAQIKPAPGNVEKALRIDRDGPYALIPGVNISPSNMPQCTLMIGLYLERIANNRGWVFGNENGGYDRTILMHDNRFGNGVASAVGKAWHPWNNAQYPPTKKWIHVTAVFRQGGLSYVYLNGIRSDRGITASNNAGLNDLWVGRPQWGGHWTDSWIKEVKVFDTALSDAAVKSHSNQFLTLQ